MPKLKFRDVVVMKSEMKKMLKSSNKLKILAPIGQVPQDDEDLQLIIKKLLPTASLSEIFAEISKWEDKAVVTDRSREHTQQTGKLVISCQ
jgi:aspartate-semialdehyde dehydrogenase